MASPGNQHCGSCIGTLSFTADRERFPFRSVVLAWSGFVQCRAYSKEFFGVYNFSGSSPPLPSPPSA